MYVVYLLVKCAITLACNTLTRKHNFGVFLIIICLDMLSECVLQMLSLSLTEKNTLQSIPLCLSQLFEIAAQLVRNLFLLLLWYRCM